MPDLNEILEARKKQVEEDLAKKKGEIKVPEIKPDEPKTPDAPIEQPENKKAVWQEVNELWGNHFQSEEEFKQFNPKTIIEEKERIKQEKEAIKQEHDKMLGEYLNPFEGMEDIQKVVQLRKSRPDLPKQIVNILATEDITQLSERDKLILDYKISHPEVATRDKQINKEIDKLYTSEKLDGIKEEYGEDSEEYREELESIEFKRIIKVKAAEGNLNTILSNIKPADVVDREAYIKAEQDKINLLGEQWVTLAKQPDLVLNKLKINASENDSSFDIDYELNEEDFKSKIQMALTGIVNQRIPITEKSKEEFKDYVENLCWCDKKLRTKMLHAFVKKQLETKEIELLKKNFGITTVEERHRTPDGRTKPLTESERMAENIRNVQSSSGYKPKN